MTKTKPLWDLVVFDCDGVILNSKPVVYTILEAMGFEGIAELLKKLFWEDPTSHLKQWGLEALKFLMALDQQYDQVEPFEGMVELIRTLKSQQASTQLVVLSSNSTATIARRLESPEVGLESAFDQIIGRDALVEFSGKAQKLKYLMADFTPERCCFVGDTRSDILAGLKASVVTIGVTWGGFHSRQDLQTIVEHDGGQDVHFVDEITSLQDLLVGSA